MTTNKNHIFGIKEGLNKSSINNCFDIVLTETWLKPHILDAEVQIEDFNIYRQDKTGKKQHGV